jgi:hypothetical protein
MAERSFNPAFSTSASCVSSVILWREKESKKNNLAPHYSFSRTVFSKLCARLCSLMKVIFYLIFIFLFKYRAACINRVILQQQSKLVLTTHKRFCVTGYNVTAQITILEVSVPPVDNYCNSHPTTKMTSKLCFTEPRRFDCGHHLKTIFTNKVWDAQNRNLSLPYN